MRKGSVAFIFVTLLIDVLGFGMVIPVMPGFIGMLTHRPSSASAGTYGLIVAVYGMMQFLCAPTLGNLSDRFGRRPVLLFSLLFNGVDYLIMACAPSVGWLFLGRFLSGIAGASFTTASAYIADVTPPEKRSVNFGIMGAAFGLGFIVGPMLGGVFGLLGPRVPFWAAAGLSILNLCYGYFVLPESLSEENRRPFSLASVNPLQSLTFLKQYPIVWSMTGSLVSTYLAQNFMQVTWVLFMSYRFHWNTGQTGLSLGLVGIISIVFQTGLARFIIPKLGEKRIILIGIASSVFEMVALSFATEGWMVYAIMVAAGMSYLSGQATQGLLSRQVGDDKQGALQGSLTGLQSLTSVVGPVISGFLFSFFTKPGRSLMIPEAPFLGSAILYLVALLIAGVVLSRYRGRDTVAPA